MAKQSIERFAVRDVLVKTTITLAHFENKYVYVREDHYYFGFLGSKAMFIAVFFSMLTFHFNHFDIHRGN